MGTFTANGPVDLVTFDLYDTLIELNPPRWERLAEAARKQGIAVDSATLRDADRLAEDYFTIENGRHPIRDRLQPRRGPGTTRPSGADSRRSAGCGRARGRAPADRPVPGPGG